MTLTSPIAKLFWAFAAAALAMLVVSVDARAQSVDNGRAIVQRNCAVCHATGPMGDSPIPEAPRFRELHKRYPVENLAEALAEGILTGHPMMPQFRFTPTEVSDIIAYLESIQTARHARAGQRDPSAEAAAN